MTLVIGLTALGVLLMRSRICPGRFIADANIWLVIANVLTVFDILPAIDPTTGEEILPEFGWENKGLTA